MQGVYRKRGLNFSNPDSLGCGARWKGRKEEKGRLRDEDDRIEERRISGEGKRKGRRMSRKKRGRPEMGQG